MLFPPGDFLTIIPLPRTGGVSGSLSIIPLINIFIGNRLVPKVEFSSTSNLLLENYKQQLLDGELIGNAQALNGTQSMINQLETKQYASIFFNAYLFGIPFGLTTNAAYLWGEERGWRDFLWNRLIKIEKLKKREDYITTSGFFKNSLLVGFYSGLWNIPFTLIGHNFGPLNSRWGTLLILLNQMLMSPLHCFITQKIKNEISIGRDYGVIASLSRGVYDALSGLTLYLSDIKSIDPSYANLLVGPNSLSTSVTFSLLNLALLSLMAGTNRFTSTSKK